MRKTKSGYTVFFFCCLFTSLLKADITVDIAEEETGVRFTITGQVDVSGLVRQNMSVLSEQGVDVGIFFTTGNFAQISGARTQTIEFWRGAEAVIELFGTGPNLPVSLENIIGEVLPYVLIDDNGSVKLSSELYTPSSGFTTATAIIEGASFESLNILDGRTSQVFWENNGEAESITFRSGSAIPVVVPETVDVEVLPAHILRFETILGATYFLQKSTDMVDWVDVGVPQGGTGALQEFCVERVRANEFYRVQTRP